MEGLAALFQEGLLALQRDLFQRLQAVGDEARAHHVHPAHALCGELLERGLGVGLEPLRLAEARLEGDQHALARHAETFGHQAAGLVALAVIGVAEIERAPRHAVEAQQQVLGLAVDRPVLAHALHQGVDVAGVVVEIAHEAHLGLVAPPRQAAADLVDYGGGGAPRVLRVHRHHQDAGAAARAHGVQGVADRGRAVAHRVVDVEPVVAVLGEVAGEQLGLAHRVHQQRRALVGPDAGVLLRRGLGPGGEDDAVEDRPPHQARDLDHARVGEELLEVGAQRGGGGGGGGAEVDQQHAGAWGAVVAIDRFRPGAGHRGPWVGFVRAARRACRSQCLEDRAFESSRAVMSTIGITRS